MEVPVRSCAHYKYKMQQIKLNVIKRSKARKSQEKAPENSRWPFLGSKSVKNE